MDNLNVLMEKIAAKKPRKKKPSGGRHYPSQQNVQYVELGSNRNKFGKKHDIKATPLEVQTPKSPESSVKKISKMKKYLTGRNALIGTGIAAGAAGAAGLVHKIRQNRD